MNKLKVEGIIRYLRCFRPGTDETNGTICVGSCLEPYNKLVFLQKKKRKRRYQTSYKFMSSL